MSKSAHEVLNAVEYIVFIAAKFSITCLSSYNPRPSLVHILLRKWRPIPAKTKIGFSVSLFFVKKRCVLYAIELFVQRLFISIQKLKKKLDSQSKIKLASWNFQRSKKTFSHLPHRIFHTMKSKTRNFFRMALACSVCTLHWESGCWKRLTGCPVCMIRCNFFQLKNIAAFHEKYVYI